jgi:hypothetical protein
VDRKGARPDGFVPRKLYPARMNTVWKMMKMTRGEISTVMILETPGIVLLTCFGCSSFPFLLCKFVDNMKF